MNWKIVVGLGLTGALPPAIAFAAGLGPALVLALWTALAALVWIPVMLRTHADRLFVGMLVVGVIAGIAAGIVDAATTGDPMLLVFGVVVGTVWGALFGGIALGIRRFSARTPHPA